VRLYINWRKSDKSGFGWRHRKEACNKAHACKPPPSPTLPRKRERERTEIAAPSAGYSLHGIPWSARPRESGTQIANLDSRLRGDERKEGRVGKGAHRSARSAAAAPCPAPRKT